MTTWTASGRRLPRSTPAILLAVALLGAAACSTATASGSAAPAPDSVGPAAVMSSVVVTPPSSRPGVEPVTTHAEGATTDASTSSPSVEPTTPAPDPIDPTPPLPAIDPPRVPVAPPEVTTPAPDAGSDQDPDVAAPAAPAPPAPDGSAREDPDFANLAAAVATMGAGNAAVSVSVWRDHAAVFTWASGADLGGEPITADTPMVLASVSKLITSLTIARLAEQGTIAVGAAVPWADIVVPHDAGWDDVTVRELLDHTSGMPKAQDSWLNDPGSCLAPLTDALARPPRASRGRWLYSNGNYCALGLLIEAATGADRATAARRLVFDPIGVTGPHLTTDVASPHDGPYDKGVARLERLGGAGTWMASSDDLAAMLNNVTPADLDTMSYPAIMADQYGWGHTGTVDGARACAWVMDRGRTIVVGIVAGNRPSSGGRVCDRIIPALAADLGIPAGVPHRLPD